MADQLLSTIIGAGGGGGGSIMQLAPDLNFPANISQGLANGWMYTVALPDTTGGMTTVLNLTGKWWIRDLYFRDMITDATLYVKLTIDGVVIWDALSSPTGTQFTLLGVAPGGSIVSADSGIMCESSFVLEVQATADTSITFRYTARPIL